MPPILTDFAPAQKENTLESPLALMQADYAGVRAIAPSLMAVATELVENTRAHETYEVLGWAEPSANWKTQKPHNFGSLLVFKNEDGSTFQAKPETPRTDEEGELVKYETPKGHGSRAYLPSVDTATRQKISEVQGVRVPLEGSFVIWLAANPQVPIVLTEGAGKALALQSAGTPAIAFMGCHGGFQASEKDPTTGLKTKLEAPRLIADLTRFLGADRPIIFAFDADTKPETVQTVNAAMRRFGRLIEATGAKVSVAFWNGKGGLTKGVDDLIATDGVEAWKKALAGALPLDEWKAKHRVVSPLTFFNGKGELKFKAPNKIVQKLAEAWGDCLAFNDNTKCFYQYSAEFPGMWTERSETLIRETIQKALDSTGVGYTDLVSSVYKLLQSKLVVTKWREKKGVTPMRNGVLDNATMELMPHSPKNFLTWQLPYEYNPLATCDPIQEWLSFTQDGDADRVQLLRAYLRAIVMGRSDLQRFIEVVSAVGGSGKSTFSNLAVALVGVENVHITDSGRIEQSRFETSNFKGKRLIYFADADRYSGDAAIGILKRVTGGDVLPYERKGKDALAPFVCNAMVLIAANSPLTTTDTAIPRRRITVPFLKSIPNENQRVLLQLDTESQTVFGEFESFIPGVLNWVLSMSDAEMVRYLKDTDRAVPSLGAVKADTLIAINPMAKWLDTCCVLIPGLRTGVGVAKKVRMSKVLADNQSKSWETYVNSDLWLYPNYIQYCDENKATAVSNKRFAELLENLCVDQLKNSEVSKGMDRQGSCFIGIGLRHDCEAHDQLPCPISGVIDVAEDSEPETIELETSYDDDFEPIPATWQALPKADRQSAETLLRSLKQAHGAAERKQTWCNPSHTGKARSVVTAHLESQDWGSPIIRDLELVTA
jgi:putative DNA primase/helicase